MTLKTVIKDMERYCNNYFNPRNDPTDPTREHPPEFLTLAEMILIYRKDESHQPTNAISESAGVLGVKQWSAKRSVTAGGVPIGWQGVFAADLSVYRRVKLI